MIRSALSWLANIIPTNRKTVSLVNAYWDNQADMQREAYLRTLERVDPFVNAGKKAHEALQAEMDRRCRLSILEDATDTSIRTRAPKERRNAAQVEQYIATHTALQGAVKAHAGE